MMTRILVETVNVDLPRCNMNTFSQKLPATVKPGIYCYACSSFSYTLSRRFCSFSCAFADE